jgi:pimeloyl-[acyl-carrier protein] methyl ester esterase
MCSDSCPPAASLIAGESFSGPLAIRLARAERHRLAALILISTFAKPPWPSALSPALRFFSIGLAPKRLIHLLMLGRGATDEQTAAIDAAGTSITIDVRRSRLSDVLATDAIRELQEIDAPVLVIHGRHDRLVPRRCARDILANKPSARVEWIDGPHDVLFTRAPECTQVIERFCEQL